MKVFILEAHVNCDGKWILGVYSSFELAEKEKLKIEVEKSKEDKAYSEWRAFLENLPECADWPPSPPHRHDWDYVSLIEHELIEE